MNLNLRASKAFGTKHVGEELHMMYFLDHDFRSPSSLCHWWCFLCTSTSFRFGCAASTGARTARQIRITFLLPTSRVATPWFVSAMAMGLLADASGCLIGPRKLCLATTYIGHTHSQWYWHVISHGIPKCLHHTIYIASMLNSWAVFLWDYVHPISVSSVRPSCVFSCSSDGAVVHDSRLRLQRGGCCGVELWEGWGCCESTAMLAMGI